MPRTLPIHDDTVNLTDGSWGLQDVYDEQVPEQPVENCNQPTLLLPIDHGAGPPHPHGMTG